MQYIALFKFTAYNAYICLQKATNLMVKQIAGSHFLGIFLWQNKLSQKTPYGKAVIKIPYRNAP